jgi:mono/diheme cytochrome c family protein
VAIGVLACTVFAGCQKSTVPAFKVPSEDSARKNPVDLTPVTIAEGQKLYATDSDCAICHGKEGDGRGVLARDVKMNVRDWHNARLLSTFTDGDLFYILAKGKGRMPGYEKKVTAEQMWQMIDYIHSLGEK